MLDKIKEVQRDKYFMFMIYVETTLKKHMKIKWLSFGKKTVIGVQKLTILGEYGPNVHMKTP